MRLWIVLCLVVVCVLGKRKPKPHNRKELQFIQCPVCELTVKQIVREAKILKDAAPKTKLMLKLEEKFIKLVENVCDPEQQEGEWISKYDVVADAKTQTAQLVEQSFFGKCKTECQTIAKSCHSVFGNYDTDVAELLIKGAKRSAIVDVICHKRSKSCGPKAKKLPPLPAGFGSEKFVLLDSKGYEMQQMMRKLKGTGMGDGLEMFNRDDMMGELRDPSVGDEGGMEGNKVGNLQHADLPNNDQKSQKANPSMFETAVTNLCTKAKTAWGWFTGLFSSNSKLDL